VKQLLERVFVIFVLTFTIPALGQTDHPKTLDGFVQVEQSVQIHYLDSGTRTKGPALVFIPGWRFPATIWKSQIDHFGSLRRVIAIDPRSQGESTKTSDGNTPEKRAGDIHELIKKLALPQVVLVGWSQGVQDVAAYITQFGMENVAGVILVDSAFSAGPAAIGQRTKASEEELRMLGFFSEHPLEYSRGMMPFMFKKTHDKDSMDALVKATMQTPASTAVSMLVTDMFTVDRRPALSMMTKPVLIVAAADSPDLDLQKEMHSRVKESELVVMEGVGHALFVDDPATFNQAVDAFLTKTIVASGRSSH
jgi:microsomal epoxide hydrolase